jgi:hypothetical protein
MHNMASALFPSFHLTSHFLQLSLLPGCLGSLQEIILVRGAQHCVPSVPPPPNKELKLSENLQKGKQPSNLEYKKLNYSGWHSADDGRSEPGIVLVQFHFGSATLTYFFSGVLFYFSEVKPMFTVHGLDPVGYGAF